jgi:hypothetical protein
LIIVGNVRRSVAEERVSPLGFDLHGERYEFQRSDVDDEGESKSYFASNPSNSEESLSIPLCTTKLEGYGSKESSRDSIIPASEKDIASVRVLFLHSHHFGKVRSRLKKKKREIIKAEDLLNDIMQFLVELGYLPSCYNTQCGRYIKCTCAKKLQAVDLSHSVEYLSAVTVMQKRDQDALDT